MRKCVLIVIMIAVSVILKSSIWAWQVPDTGQTDCYDDEGRTINCPDTGQEFAGQDGSYTINPPSYTKLDSNGNSLSASATSWAMVKDNVTGLIWEKKTNKDGSSNYVNPHDADNVYGWYDSKRVSYGNKIQPRMAKGNTA